MLSATACEDGCVRNSDCAEGFTCGDGLCILEVTLDASLDATPDEDSGK